MMMVERLEQVARNGALGGYARLEGHRKVTLRLAMDCVQPYRATMFSRVSATHGKKVQPFTVWIEAQCRKCSKCKSRRAMYWQGRAMTEYLMAPRTLFGTITMSVAEHQRLDDLIHVRLAKGRVLIADLSQRELFEERVKEFGAEVTKYLDRLRKGDETHPRPIRHRYLLIAEVHDSDKTSEEMRGRPHFHLLIHEEIAGQLVHGDPMECILTGERSGEYIRKFRKDRFGRWQPIAVAADDAFIRKNWTLGFTNLQWAQSAASAVYVCKYLSKSLMLRVRASQHYGDEEWWAAMATSSQKHTEGKASLPETASGLDPLGPVVLPASGLNGEEDDEATEL